MQRCKSSEKKRGCLGRMSSRYNCRIEVSLIRRKGENLRCFVFWRRGVGCLIVSFFHSEGEGWVVWCG